VEHGVRAGVECERCNGFQVIQALGAVLPVEREKLSETIEDHWYEWDPDQSGYICMNEFTGRGGLKDYIMQVSNNQRKFICMSELLLRVAVRRSGPYRNQTLESYASHFLR